MLKSVFLALLLLLVALCTSSAQSNLPDSVKKEISTIRKIEKSGKFAEAIANTEPYLIKYRKHPQFAAYFYLRLGTSFCLSYKCKIGLTYFKKAHGLGISVKDTTLLGKSSLGIGAAYQFLHNNIDSALYYYSVAKPYLTHTKDSIELIGLNSNIIMLLENSPNKEESYLKLAKIREGLDDWLGATAIYQNLGLLYLESNMPQKAYNSFYTSYAMAIEHGFNNDAVTAQRGLIKASYYLGKPDEAFKHFLAYDSLTMTRLHSEEYGDKILELETKFKTAEFERDNLLKQAEIDESKLRLTFLYIAVSVIFLLAITGFFYLDQRRKHMKLDALRKNEKAQQRIKDLVKNQEVKTAYALLEGQDKERKRIAQDLHDNMGSILVTLNMYADTLEAVKKDKDVKQLARQISKLAQQANTANRNVAHSLDSGTLRHFGLKTALTDLAEAIKQANGMQIALEMDFTKIENVETGVNLYRIVQELFNNTLKHAEATRIGLELTEAKGRLCLIYEDNGIGFDTNEVKENSMGLANLKARAESIGGEITIDSALGKGTTAILEVENG